VNQKLSAWRICLYRNAENVGIGRACVHVKKIAPLQAGQDDFRDGSFSTFLVISIKHCFECRVGITFQNGGGSES
jgi:hypothetical protein